MRLRLLDEAAVLVCGEFNRLGLTGVEEPLTGLLESLVFFRPAVPSKGRPERLRRRPVAALRKDGKEDGAIVNLVFWPMVTLTSCLLFNL